MDIQTEIPQGRGVKNLSYFEKNSFPIRIPPFGVTAFGMTAFQVEGTMKERETAAKPPFLSLTTLRNERCHSETTIKESNSQ